jgi:hypothetical protein
VQIKFGNCVIPFGLESTITLYILSVNASNIQYNQSKVLNYALVAGYTFGAGIIFLILAHPVYKM